ncbi:MAG TPA: hypothetical protein VL001_07150 [Candidimonas sp.]|nr:hypothetical protein [Candidimonas sp.]
MQRALSFHDSPPLSVPLRFFLNVPIFGVLAGLTLLIAGPQALVSRWTSYSLALTHLLTLGLLASAMTGALMQILPVATGVTVAGVRTTATVVHAGLTAGALCLAAAFLWPQPWLFKAALFLLAVGFLWFLCACALGFWRFRGKALPGATEVLATVRLALAALLITAVLGVILASGMAWSLPLPFDLLTHIHASWGLLGWVGLLVIGIAFQVLPIFQVTELYPRTVTKWLPLSIFVLLLALSAGLWFQINGEAIVRVAGAWLGAAYVVFAAATLYLLWTRKRPKPDTTTLFWRTSMASLACCAPVWLGQTLSGSDYAITLGILFMAGFAWSAVNGMLYKIIPFLLWHAAQKDLKIALRVVPKVKDIIPDTRARPQYWAHLLSLLLLLAAGLWPRLFSHAAGAAAMLSAAWLAWNMASGLRLYIRAKKEIALALVGT